MALNSCKILLTFYLYKEKIITTDCETGENIIMGRCIIVGAGDFSDLMWKKTLTLHKDDLIIAADGGYDHLKGVDIVPNIVIGDMDSLNDKRGADSENSDIEICRLPVEKDDTDMLAAIRMGLEKGYKDFLIFGALGGRFDHTFANLQCLLFLLNRNARGKLYGNNETIEMIRNEKITFPKEMEGSISVFAFEGDAEGVTEKGLKYGLENAVLKSEFPIGVSNEFVGTSSSIEVTDGTLLINVRC